MNENVRRIIAEVINGADADGLDEPSPYHYDAADLVIERLAREGYRFVHVPEGTVRW